MREASEGSLSGSHAHGNHRKLWLVLTLSVTYMVAEIFGGLMSGSLALIADAGHMAVDSAAVALSLFAAWIAQKPATSQKTFGYYRAEILAALVNGAALVLVAFWIFLEAYHRFRNPSPIQGGWMLAFATGGLVVNLIGLYITHRHEHDNLNMRSVWLHILSDTLGSVSAMVAGLLVWKFGWTLADPIISVALGLLLLYGAWNLVSECVNVLLEGVPKEIDVDSIRKALNDLSSTAEVHDLHVWTLASGVPSLSAHIRLNKGSDPSQALKGITQLLKESFHIEHVTIQLEPHDFEHPSLDFCHKG